jgi:Flp pilus assembly protein TadG
MGQVLNRLFDTLRRPLARFWRGEEAAIVAEAVIVLPVLLWSYIGLFVYWDSFRSLNTVQKAAYTVSDIISRENPRPGTGITSAYITGMNRVVQYLIDQDQISTMRVTSVSYSDANKRFEVHWSRTTNAITMPPQTTQTLQNYANQIPAMSPGDYVVIVEVKVPYIPAFNTFMGDQTFSEFIVTRPRFVPCIAMDNISCPVT